MAIKTGDWVTLKEDPSKTVMVVDEVRASGHFTVTAIPGAWFTPDEVKVVKMNSAVRSTNAIVQNALKALNGTVEDKYRVTLDTLTLDGKGKTSKVVTAAKLKQILIFLRQPETYETVLAQVAKHGRTDIAAEMPLDLIVERA